MRSLPLERSLQQDVEVLFLQILQLFLSVLITEVADTSRSEQTTRLSQSRILIIPIEQTAWSV